MRGVWGGGVEGHGYPRTYLRQRRQLISLSTDNLLVCDELCGHGGLQVVCKGRLGTRVVQRKKQQQQQQQQQQPHGGETVCTSHYITPHPRNANT